MLSNINFHTDDFILISYNAMQKFRLANRAFFRMKGKQSIQNKIAHAKSEEMVTFLKNIQEKKCISNYAGYSFTF